MPPRSQLYVLTRLWIELTREMSRIHAPHVEERFGSGASDTLLCTAVYLGMTEDREMSAGKLADFVGLPRPTVLRRLDALERAGLVERRGMTWRTPLKALARAEKRHLAMIADMIEESLDELRR
jgi:DNA-binding transcriptional ArsR family regulator